MKFDVKHIPEYVKNNVVYNSNEGVVTTTVIDAQYKLWCQGKPATPKEHHNFVKEVVIHNKLEVFKHLMSQNLVDHLPDLVYYSCQHGHKEMTEIIMKTGRVIPDHVTKHGWTAVEIAAINGHYDIVEMLINKEGTYGTWRGSINMENKYNKNRPLESAIEGGHLETVKRMIVDLGARFIVKDEIFQEKDAKLEVLQGELLPQHAGKEEDYEDIRKFLMEKHEEGKLHLPSNIRKKLDLLLANSKFCKTIS